jgi:hypothetical protein
MGNYMHCKPSLSPKQIATVMEWTLYYFFMYTEGCKGGVKSLPKQNMCLNHEVNYWTLVTNISYSFHGTSLTLLWKICPCLWSNFETPESTAA